MLSFFRKNQRLFLIIVTVMIIVSFSFFGTYGSNTGKTEVRDPVVFKTLSGRSVHRSEQQQMALFLSTDAHDKAQYGPQYPANFLNDGLVRHDFLESGLGEQLILTYLNELSEGLEQRGDRERHFTAYVHPEARFLSAERVWSYFAPQLVERLASLRNRESMATPEAVHDRIALYLEEQDFPQTRLKQVLAYQEQQYGWVSRDPYLLQRDMALFGHHTLEEWFGPRFPQLIAQVVINAASEAQQRGYSVTDAEAEAELLRNAEKAYQRDAKHLGGMTDSRQYMEAQLRAMGLDFAAARDLWKQVLLYRRLMNDAGSSILLDPFMYRQFYCFAAETVNAELFRMQESLYLPDYGALQNFEVYLDAVADRQQLESPLDLPQEFRSVEAIKCTTPELIQRRYLVRVGEAHRSTLALKIGLKEIWDWELDETNWPQIVERWPELASYPCETRKERLVALDTLDKGCRTRVDTMAQQEIMASHPEWVDHALASVPMRQEVLSIRTAGGPPPLTHIHNRTELQRLLDMAPLPGEEATAEQHSAKEALLCYSDDDNSFYRIELMDRADDEEILSFSEAQKLGVLNSLVEQRLTSRYEAMRRKEPMRYMRDDGQWRSLSEVRYEIADDLFNHLLAKFQEGAHRASMPVTQWAAANRFTRHLENVRDALRKEGSSDWVVEEESGGEQEKLSPAFPLTDQWKVVRVDHTALRSVDQLLQPRAGTTSRDPYEMAIGEWSEVFLPLEGKGVCFFHVVGKNTGELLKSNRIVDGQKSLAHEMQSVLLTRLIELCKSNNSIVFEDFRGNEDSAI